MPTTQKYQMDDSTFEHLTAWVERETHTQDEALLLREEMISFLTASDVEDATYSISHGWWHVYDLLRH